MKYPIKISTEKSEETLILFPTTGKPKERFRFRVLANDDVHIALTSSADIEDSMYDFAIGRSTVLFKKTVAWKEVVKADTSGCISDRTMKELWVEFENKLIAIGQWSREFIKYKEIADDLPLIKFVGIRTGGVVRGDWEIEPPSAVFATVPSSGNHYTNFLPIFGSTFKFTLTAKPAKAAFVLLSSTPSKTFPSYELHLGGRFNNHCGIYRSGEEKRVVEFKEEILSETQDFTFWVRWSNKGDISFGREGKSALISWTDTTPFDINFAAFRTDLEAHGNWRVEQSDIDLQIKASRKYGNFIPNSSGRLDFKLRSSGEAYLALTAKPEDTRPMYELVLGKYNNFKSTIGRNHVETNRASTPYLLDKDRFIGFAVIWGDGEIRVHKEGSSNPFLTIDDPANLPINYVGFRNDKTTIDHYILKMPRPFVPRSPPSPTWGYDNWVSCENGDVPPFRAFSVVPGLEHSYVIRAHFQGDLIPGMLGIGEKSGYVTRGGRSHARSQYEVLCDFNGDWQECHGSDIPENALVTGRTAEGEDLYVGRVKDRGLYVVGKVQLSEGVCYISRDANELSFANYEILVRLDF